MSLPKTITISVQIDHDSGHREFEDFSYDFTNTDEDAENFEEWIGKVGQRLIDMNYDRINGRMP